MTSINESKKALLDYKQKILADIKYYEKTIEDFRASERNNNFYDDNSSDSEDDWLSAINVEPKAIELKREQSKLRTYLQATQELTGLTVLQFEVNVLVEEPTIEGEPPVLEAGTWREVTAECRADLVPFSITFFIHTPDRKFAQPSYRGVRVGLVKPTHEAELANSVLHTLRTPSDAVEVLRSYAASYRSRRTTLARLATKFTSTLAMEPHDEGGFVLKCSDLLEVIWRLENKWSPVAPFHHKMKFDLEYMDESYIKIISQCHKQLSDPSLHTDERTLILAKIITTCLEAKGPHDSSEAVESDLETKPTDCDPKRDSEVMAPPKSLPKKAKAKPATNLAQKRSNDDESSRMNTNDNNDNASNDENSKNVPNTTQQISISDRSKRIKTNDSVKNKENTRKLSNIAQKTSVNDNEASKRMKSNDNARNDMKAKNGPNTAQKRSINDNNNDGSKRMKSNDNVKATGNTKVAKASQNKIGNTENISKDVNAMSKAKKNIVTSKNSVNTVPNATEVNENTVGNPKNVNANPNKDAKEAKNVPENINVAAKNKIFKGKGKHVAPTKNLINHPEAGDHDAIEAANTKSKANKDKNKMNKAPETDAVAKDSNEMINDKNKGDSDLKNVANTANAKKAHKSRDNQIADIKKSVANTKNTADSANAKRNIMDSNENPNAIVKNSVAKTKNDNISVANSKKNINNDPISAGRLKTNTINKEKNDNKTKNDTMMKGTERNIANAKNKDKIADRIPENKFREPIFKMQAEKIISGNFNNKLSNNILLTTGNIKTSNIFKSGNIEKENGRVTSKIPQKKLTPISEKSLKSNPLRISPRTFPSKFKTQLSNKNVIKTTSIPRLLKKSVPKTH